MTTKTFDCVEMKRRSQEKIHAETQGMTQEELIEYFHRAAAEFWAGVDSRGSQRVTQRTPAVPQT
ncbi:MAG: hypothetical protein COY42_16745 [Armatimonadetes bacterium CG_4_10_14_0_8_um_filter_66_14]|nr:MAG: hypothetical protein COY42_16745 [Armatimonadetes bacterium CG_4_10_14_0_8_um_filter_66_14]